MDEDSAERLDDAIRSVAHAITPVAAPGRDDFGGHIESLTEAVMSVSSGLKAIADAIGGLAAAVLERGGDGEA